MSEVRGWMLDVRIVLNYFSSYFLTHKKEPRKYTKPHEKRMDYL